MNCFQDISEKHELSCTIAGLLSENSGDLDMAFRICCPNCKTAAVITHSNDIAADIDGVFAKDLYVACRNHECGATFVVRAAFEHYINPPNADVVDLARRVLQAHDQQHLRLQ